MQLPVIAGQDIKEIENYLYKILLIKYALSVKQSGLTHTKILDKAIAECHYTTDGMLKQYVQDIFACHSSEIILNIFQIYPKVLFKHCSIEELWSHVTATRNLGVLVGFMLGYKELLEGNFYPRKHVSPIHLVASYSGPMVLDLAMRLGLRFDVVSENNESILHYALRNQHSRIILEFLKSIHVLPTLVEISQDLPISQIMQLYPKQPRLMTIVLDLDGTLVLEDNGKDDFFKIFIKKGLVITACGINYIILPGALELIRKLADMPNVEIAFYSHGTEKRNAELIYGLLSRSVGESRADIIFTECKIFSRNDCFPHIQELENQQDKFDVKRNAHTKPLLQVRHTLNDVLIIEDRRESAFPGQVENLLFLRLNAKREKFLQAFRNIRTQHKAKAQSSRHDFYYANQLFFAGGVLWRAFTKVYQQPMYLREALLSIQYQQEGEKFVLRKELSKDRTIYNEGKIFLKHVHDKVDFYSSRRYRSFFRREREFIRSNQQILEPSIVTPTMVGAVC